MSNKSATNLQDAYLNYLRKEKIAATIYTINGFQIKNAGIKGFDNFVIIIEADNKQTMIYKHAVSSIAPSSAVNLSSLIQKDEQ
ncbi:MAG: RNA-binding protein Hfq [Firmicutes bacterium ADurb.Bin182]|nr:MAG: RNA-binding protein Hfq [Firmicutes bacterium ADurb.Bin182]